MKIVIIWFTIFLLSFLTHARKRYPRVPWGLTPLQWGEVTPVGWALDWANAARKGAVSPTRSWFASGNGSNDRSNGWRDFRPEWAQDEQSAYWIDGMTRLGLVLRDSEMFSRAREDIVNVIAKAEFIEGDGPEGWPRANYARSMLAYFDATNDTSVLRFFEGVWPENYTMDPDPLARSMAQCEAMLESYSFGASESLLAVCLKGLQQHQAPYLQAFVDAPCHNFTNESPCFNASFETTHGVTFNELMKVWGMASGWLPDDFTSTRYLEVSVNAYEQANERDMLPYGVFSAEEALSGIAPNASTELCDISDFIHSTTWLLRVTGDGKYGDRLERAFFNAAPASVSRDWTTHVYFQSPNLQRIPHDQYRLPGERWTMKEYHDPACCTGNQARLLPNFIHHMFMKNNKNNITGISLTMYGPVVAETFVGGSSSGEQQQAEVPIQINITTFYPLSEVINISLFFPSFEKISGKAPRVNFTLALRIPLWCSNPSLTINNENQPVTPDKLQFHSITRVWENGDTLSLTLPMKPQVSTHITVNNGGLVGNGYADGNRNNYVQGGLPYAQISFGPLLFALPLEADPSKGWQYALNNAVPLQVVRSNMPAYWDWPLDAPIKIIASGHAIEWEDVWTMPTNPVPGNTSVPLTLVPYGCTKVFRISMFPYLA